MQLALFDSPSHTRSDCAPPSARSTAAVALLEPLHPARAPHPAPDLLDTKVAQYLRDARAERTLRAYRTDWQSFVRWCAGAGELALPASSRTLARYLTHLAELGRRPSTIRRARIAIGQMHALAHMPRPDHDPNIRTLERGIGRHLGTREHSAPPLLGEDLPRVVAAAAEPTARDVRDRALVLIGFAGAYRASDLAALQIEHSRFTPEGVRLLLPRGKEDPLGRGQWTLLPCVPRTELCPTCALRAWLKLLGEQSGPLFRTVRGGRIEARPLSTRAVARTVQRLTALAGLQGTYSAHSLRAGLATTAHACGLLERDIQAHGRWLDRRSLDRYIDVTAGRSRPNVAACVLR